jgi:hypothetical protein
MTRARNPWSWHRAGVILAFFLGISGLPGCGDKRKPVFPVRGQVLVDGRPAENAIIIFHSLDPPGSSREPRPRAVIGPDGRFEVTTYEPNDGAPAGNYRISVIWKTKSLVGDSDEKNLLPVRYMSPRTSGLSATVEEGPNDLPPFQLTRR